MPDNLNEIHTGGGSSVHGDVTSGGAFIGRDQININYHSPVSDSRDELERFIAKMTALRSQSLDLKVIGQTAITLTDLAWPHLNKEHRALAIRYLAGAGWFVEGDTNEIYSLKGRDMSGLDLSGINLRFANLRNASLKDSNLSGARLDKTNCSYADLQNTNLAMASLSEAELHGTVFLDTDLSEANLTNAKLQLDKLVKGAKTTGAKLHKIYIGGGDLHISDARRRELSYEEWRSIVADFSNLDLKYTEIGTEPFDACNPYSVDFSKANLSGAKFGVSFRPARGNFTEANLDRATFSGSYLNYANFQNANLQWAKFLTGEDIWSREIVEADLSDARFGGANLKGADLRKAKKSKLRLKGAQLDSYTKIEDKWRLAWYLANGNAQGRMLRRADLREIYLEELDLSELDFSDSILAEAEINNVRFVKARLARVDFQATSCTNVDFTGADMRKAIFIGANLEEVNFTGADLSGAKLQGTPLNLARFQGGSLVNAEFDSDTTWPDGFDPLAAGARYVELPPPPEEEE